MAATSAFAVVGFWATGESSIIWTIVPFFCLPPTTSPLCALWPDALLCSAASLQEPSLPLPLHSSIIIFSFAVLWSAGSACATSCKCRTRGPGHLEEISGRSVMKSALIVTKYIIHIYLSIAPMATRISRNVECVVCFPEEPFQDSTGASPDVAESRQERCLKAALLLISTQTRNRSKSNFQGQASAT